MILIRKVSISSLFYFQRHCSEIFHVFFLCSLFLNCQKNTARLINDNSVFISLNVGNRAIGECYLQVFRLNSQTINSDFNIVWFASSKSMSR